MITAKQFSESILEDMARDCDREQMKIKTYWDKIWNNVQDFEQKILEVCEMNYERLVPSRELCEKLRSLNICQDGAELWWNWTISEGWIVQDSKGRVIAPTLPRMMEELTEGTDIVKYNGEWCLYYAITHNFICSDKHLPNAVAKALIAIKESDHAE